MARHEARDLGELLEAVEDIHALHREDERGGHLWYRGHADESWALIPSVQRQGVSGELERGLSNDFYIRASRIVKDAPPRDDYASWLSLMQHYGVPTRLLDWSESPLIAAFFAATKDGYEERDGCVWVLRPDALNRGQGDDCLHPLDSWTAKAMMHSAFKSSEEPAFVRDRDILACYSVGSDVRMYAQQACFTIHRSRKVRLEGDGFDSYVHKIVIPGSSKRWVRHQLALAGISDRFVYPDLEHVGLDVRQMYGL